MSRMAAWASLQVPDTISRPIFSQVFHTHNASVLLATAAEIRTMDAIYLLMLAGLYVVTHGLVLALNRLGRTS